MVARQFCIPPAVRRKRMGKSIVDVWKALERYMVKPHGQLVSVSYTYY